MMGCVFTLKIFLTTMLTTLGNLINVNLLKQPRLRGKQVFQLHSVSISDSFFFVSRDCLLSYVANRPIHLNNSTGLEISGGSGALDFNKINKTYNATIHLVATLN